MNEANEFISSVGYPIFISCVCGVIIYKIFITVIVPIVDRFFKTLDIITDTNKTLADTNSTFVSKMDKLDNNLVTVNSKLDKVLEVVDKHD